MLVMDIVNQFHTKLYLLTEVVNPLGLEQQTLPTHNQS